MVLFVKFLSLAALSHAFAMQSLDRRQKFCTRPTADPGTTNYYLSLANNATRSLTTDTKVFKGNSTNFDDDFGNLYVGVFNAADSCEPPHIEGSYSKTNAHAICKFINVTLSGNNKKFLNTVVANKKKLAQFNYTSAMIDNLNDIRNQYQYLFEYVPGACCKDSAACFDAGPIIDNQYATAVAALSS